MQQLCGIGGSSPVSRTIHAPDGAIHYLELRKATDPAPVLFIHGAGGGAANWYRLFGPVSRTRGVIAVDLPGFGLTDPRPLTAPLGVHAAHFIRDFLDAIGVERVTLVGTSFGGLAAMRFAQHFPARADKLVLIDTAGAGPGVTPLVRAARLPLAALLLKPSRRGTRWLLRHLLVRRRLPPAEEAALVEYLYQSAKRGSTRHFVEALRLFADGAVQAELPTDAEMRAVTSHTMIVWGTRDRFFPPAHAETLARRMPNAVVHMIEGAGHSPNWEKPDELATRLCEFLNG
jgi:pimeloyl-ACP methyl ester carboxylesterase